MYKLSICCITYNQEKFIAQALDGFLMQHTDFDFEIIVGDDCSTDNTAIICMEYQKKYPRRISLIRHKKNIGMMPNFIQTLSQCTGKYIALCEGDDYWCDENKLQKQVDFLEANSEYSVCFHKVIELINGQLVNSKTNTSLEEETYTITQLAKGNFIHTPSVIFRNKLFTEFPQWFNISPVGDYVLHMLNARHGAIKYFPQPMAVYRSHNGGIWSSNNKTNRLEKWLIVLDFLLQETFEPDVKQILFKQKAVYREAYLKVLMNAPDWKVFLKKLSDYSKEDENISQKWLIEYYPQYITFLKASQSYQLSELIRRFISKFNNGYRRLYRKNKIKIKN